jgi:hypothetical protein
MCPRSPRALLVRATRTVKVRTLVPLPQVTFLCVVLCASCNRVAYACVRVRARAAPDRPSLISMRCCP